MKYVYIGNSVIKKGFFSKYQRFLIFQSSANKIIAWNIYTNQITFKSKVNFKGLTLLMKMYGGLSNLT